MQNNRSIKRVVTFGLGVALGLSFLSGTASAAPAKERGNQGQTSSTKDCDGTHHSKTGHGANDSAPHAYNETCDENIASGNGGGNGEAGGKPCAGCVGNADDKNPPGQYPSGPGDHNNGYECDQKGRSENEGNNGIGFGNPAHSGCAATPAPTGGQEPPACPAGPAAMTGHSYVIGTGTFGDLSGNVHASDHVVANFTIAAECPALPVTLVSYEFVGNNVKKEFDKATGSFGAGPGSLDVDIPRCAFAVDFLVGDVVIDSDHAMNATCDEPIVPVTPAAGPTPVVESAGVLPVALEATPAVLAADVIAETPAAVITPEARATEVQGVQLERGTGAVAGAGLARTGLTLLPLVGLGTALCLLGMALSSARRREGEGFIAIGNRLAGF